MKETPFSGPVPLNDNYISVVEDIYGAFEDLHTTILRLVPEGRYRSKAITDLETAAMWAVKGLCMQAKAEAPNWNLDTDTIIKIRKYVEDRVTYHKDLKDIVRENNKPTQTNNRHSSSDVVNYNHE